jgi:hypothetical protein
MNRNAPLRLRTVLIASAAITLLASARADAAILTRCGASVGQAYRLPGPLSDAEGWDREELTQGELMLMLDPENHTVDVITKDATRMTSSRSEGFNTYVLANDNLLGGADLLVYGVQPETKVMEHYLFRLDEHGNGMVMWGTVRAGGPLPKSSLMRAECKAPV